MRSRHGLQFLVWLAGLSLAHPAAAGLVPDAQVAVLTEGLLHLLSGLEESGRFVQQQSRQAEQELRRHARQLGRLRRRAGRVDRRWAGLKRELQVGAARTEGLWARADALQQRTGWDAVDHRLTRVQEMVRILPEPGGVKATELNLTFVQAEMEAQDRRLSALRLEMLIQDKLMDQQERLITELQAFEARKELLGFL